jgi:hypothetical protein
MIEVIVISVACLMMFIISIIPADKHTITDMATFLLHCLLPSSVISVERTLKKSLILFKREKALETAQISYAVHYPECIA